MLLYRVFRSRRGQFNPAESQLFIAACLSSIVLLLPLSNSDYFKRFFLLSLLPQLLMLAMLRADQWQKQSLAPADGFHAPCHCPGPARLAAQAGDPY
jgi:hypothetical protein